MFANQNITAYRAADIDDGCTRAAIIPEGESSPALRIEYRRMLAADRRRMAQRLAWYARGGSNGLAAAERLAANELARRIVFWSLTDEGGSPVEISPDVLLRLDPELSGRILEIIAGIDQIAEYDRIEADEAARLAQGVRLHFTAPQVATRSCDDCQKHVYDERSGRRELFRGQPVVRPAGTVPPCQMPHVGCPKGTPENDRSLSEWGRKTYRHYLDCRATGSFPDDPLVRRNARVIRQIEEDVENRRRHALERMVARNVRRGQ